MELEYFETILTIFIYVTGIWKTQYAMYEIKILCYWNLGYKDEHLANTTVVQVTLSF